MRNIYLTTQEAEQVQARRNRVRGFPSQIRIKDQRQVLPLTDGEYAFVLRLRAGLSLREVADRLGVSAVTVRNRECGIKGDPTSLIELLEPEVNDAVHFHTNPRPTA